MRLKQKIVTVSIIGIIAVCLTGSGIHYFSSSAKRALEKQILAMKSLAINLDFANAAAIYEGKDSTYQSADVRKLVLFVDSTSCSPCVLSHFVNYYDISESLSLHNGELLVVLHPQQGRLDEVKKRMRHERFPFWCIVDSVGVFVKNNPGIPENQLLHTFALDEQNKVILVGDPTRNDRIKELFYREVLR